MPKPIVNTTRCELPLTLAEMMVLLRAIGCYNMHSQTSKLDAQIATWVAERIQRQMSVMVRV